MKQYVTIATESDLVEIQFTGNYKKIIISPQRMEKVLRDHMTAEAKKLNDKLKKPLYGINDET